VKFGLKHWWLLIALIWLVNAYMALPRDFGASFNAIGASMISVFLYSALDRIEKLEAFLK